MNKDRDERTEEQVQFLDGAEAFRDYIRSQTRRALADVFEQELRALCGKRYGRGSEGSCCRSGSAPSFVMTEAGREPMQRPRVREVAPDGSSKEVTLKSWKLAQSPDEWEAATMRAVLCGVSTRDMPSLRESELKGQSKSQVSRLWQRKSAELVEQMQQADLSGFDLVVLMLDAVVLSAGLVATVALGINAEGEKKVLGFRVGSSESKQVCRDLLSNLVRRGLSAPEGRYLFAVLDGSEALKRALLEVYPDTLIQRCLVHKERNLQGYLSNRHWGELARLFKRLRQCQGAEQAKEAAEAIESLPLGQETPQGEGQLAGSRSRSDCLAPAGRFQRFAPARLLSTNCIEKRLQKTCAGHIREGLPVAQRAPTPRRIGWLASGLILASKRLPPDRRTQTPARTGRAA